jgi:hypothetical protein
MSTLRIGLVRALEAAEVGDYRLVVDLLLVLLDELDAPPVVKRHVCVYCDQAFEWPGLLDAHFCPMRFQRRFAA